MIISTELEELRVAVYELLQHLDRESVLPSDILKVRELMKDYKPPVYFKDLKRGDRFKAFDDEYVKTSVVNVGTANYNAVCIETGIHHFFAQTHITK